MKILLCAKLIGVFLLQAPLLAQSPFYNMEDTTLSDIRDQRTGLAVRDFSTSKDKGRMNASLYTHADLRKANELLGFEVNYASRQSFGWLEFGGSLYRGHFSRITKNNAGLGPGSEELDETASTLLTVSSGLSYRTTYIQHFFPDNWFETISAALTYQIMQEPHRDQTFRGPGLKTDFGIQKRTSQTNYWGVKASYQISSLQWTDKPDGLSRANRSLIVNWLSIGFELGFYF